MFSSGIMFLNSDVSASEVSYFQLSLVSQCKNIDVAPPIELQMKIKR